MTGAAARPRRELLLRLGSAVVLAPSALVLVLLGAEWFAALAAAALALGGLEWSRVTGVPFPASAIVALAPVAALAAFLGGDLWLSLGAALAFSLAAAGLATGARAWAGAGALYLSLPGIACLWLMAVVEDGAHLTIWMLMTVWTTDSFAYVAGRGLGGPKLAPRISPGKTWSGLLGGIAGAAVASALFAAFFEQAPWSLGALAAALAVVAQGGDLMKSAVKRRFGVKDFGRLIPGHGGVIDRIDGLLAVAPVLALIVAATGMEQGPPGWW